MPRTTTRRPARSTSARRPASKARGPLPDRHVLYERAVQDPSSELPLIERVLRRAGVPARRLREDFSGTALLAASWVAAGPERTAVALDLDPEVHAWARAHHVPRLGAASERLELVCADVRHGPRGPFDLVVALNFSYQVFKTRQALREYLAAARRSLAPGGVFMLDVFGGWLSQQPRVEKRRLRGGVTYVWEHEAFDPITHQIRCAIHFELAGGRRMRRAFHYDWRLWTLPELTELLGEAGFGDVEVLWDVAPSNTDVDYRFRRRAQNQGGWLAYVVARRPGGAQR
ncbi:MAG TPA: class I SAM-dependent methyltransferase [Anaeromyxobacteraceae bacterium]|nr:class I SAM-dependent methyltransferase [Anaeromyxobacteraceae bacterium]